MHKSQVSITRERSTRSAFTMALLASLTNKGDFAYEMVDCFLDSRLLDWLCLHSDLNFPLDDITWFLLEKVQRPTDN